MVSADKIFTESQLSRLLKKMRIEKDKSLSVIAHTDKRVPGEVRIVVDYFLFSLIAHTGIRVSESAKLKKEDLHEDFLIIRPEISKNKKKGTVYFGPKTRRLLDEFLEIKKNILRRDHWDLLFSVSGKVTSRSYLHTRIKFWIKQANLPDHLSTHSLRHTYGTYCLDHGLSLKFVRDNLRHSNISVTSQYLHLTKKNREKVKELF